MPDILQMKNISYQYPDTKKEAVSNVSLKIAAGSWTCIIGHNGSGKSTLTRLINGLLVPKKAAGAKIVVDGQVLTNQTLWQIRDKVGIVFQNPDNQFVGATVADDVAFGLENRGVPRDKMVKLVNKAVSDVGMSEYLNAEPANLSGGQKQRVAIAGIIAVAPKIIILDEATSMLDPNGRATILRLVRKIKKEANLTVISITHDIDEADLADQIVVMNDGKLIAQDSPTNIFKQTALIKKIGLGEPFIFKLEEKLRAQGIKIPTEIDTEKKLVEYLCQLNSKM